MEDEGGRLVKVRSHVSQDIGQVLPVALAHTHEHILHLAKQGVSLCTQHSPHLSGLVIMIHAWTLDLP